MKQRKIFAILAMVLVLVLSVGVFAACNPKEDGPNGGGTTTKTVDGTKYCLDSVESGGAAGGSLTVTMDYTLAGKEDHSSDADYEKYSAALGDFYKAYVAAMAQTDADGRYAAMAIAEAKLLQSGTYVPTSSNGGTLGLSRVAPGTVSSALWGNDQNRFHNVVVATDFIKSADRDEMKAKYAELKGTGTYEAWAKSYLTGKGYTLKDSYTKGYSADPKTWDILNTMRSADAEAIINTFDNLVEYDNEGRLMSALATSYTVSEDKLTYTFKLRENVMWVDKDGRARYEVTAQNWVDGLQRALTTGATSYLVTGVIKNAAEYAAGKITDFSQVGVKAVDKYTLEYTLEKPCTYFISMFNYNPLAPFCKEYADSVGDKYGTSPEYILYCGPYLVSNYTANNKIVFSANPLYWAKDSITIKTLTWLSYAENKDTTKTFNDAVAGTIDGAALNTTTLALAKKDYADKIYVSGTDATAFGFFMNIDREAYQTIEGYGMKSEKTDAQKSVAKAAFSNTNFRMALARSIDKKSYNAQVTGDDAALYSLGNMYTPGSFVQLSKDVTIKINGTAKTFAKGTYYGAIVQAQLNADMGKDAMKVWDPTADEGLGSSSGFDGWYNVSVAQKYFTKALEELKAQGVDVSESNPIVVDYPYYSGLANYANRAQALKQNIEAAFGGKVKINLVETNDMYGWYYAGYYCEAGNECNYDFYDVSGWGPDFKDPQSYLATMIPGGDMIKMLGLY